MSVKLVVAGRPPLELEDEYITLGSDPGCSVAFPDIPEVKPKHAVIHLVAGRWLIEARQAATLFIGTAEPKQMYWLNSGDVIQLSPNGPAIAFHATDSAAAAPIVDLPLPVAESPKLVEQKTTSEDAPLRLASDKPVPRDSDPIIPTVKLAGSAKPPSSTVIKTTKPPSSAIIPVMRPESLSTPDMKKPPSSKTIKTAGATSSSNSPDPSSPNASDAGAKSPPTSKTNRRTGPSSAADIPSVGSPPSSKPGVPKAPSSTTIRTTKPPSSTTIKTRVPLSSDTIPTVKSPAKPPRSDANVAASSGKNSGFDTQSLLRGSNDAESEAKLPVLKRLSSWEMPIPGSDLEGDLDDWEGDTSLRRKRPSHDADIRFIKTVVIRCAVALVGILILWQGYRELMKSMSGPRIDVPATSCVATEKPGTV